MQGRIFAELARWVQLDDQTLTAELAGLAGDGAAATPQRLARARTLFAHAIETPGGLKIQTIHAFAERALHLFPLEAGVPLNFEVVEAGEAKAMRLAARKATIALAVSRPASKIGLALGEIISAGGTERFEKALDAALEELSTLRLRDEPIAAGPEREERYRRLFGIEAGQTLQDLEEAFLRARPIIEEVEQLIEAGRSMSAAGGNDSRAFDQLHRAIVARRNGRDWAQAYLAVFLTAKNEERANAFTKSLKGKLSQLDTFETAEKAAVLQYLERRRAIASYNRSLALLSFAEEVLERFETAKRTRAFLDFNDLISALRRLLVRADASWIMMKLDSTIEHVLIDEAQDTTREMWDIVRALTGEFFAGEGRTKRFRSLFVVGDEKQSIFSFQGADPAVFEETRHYFAEQSLGRAGPEADARQNRIRHPVPLRSSFRSSADVLAAVDKVFGTTSRAEGLGATPLPTVHHAARASHPGLAELWPVDFKEAEAEGPARNGLFALADRIAERIAGLLATGRHLSGGEPVRPGDILILVQRRGGLFKAILKALKQRAVPVSGADRLKLQEELVIRDLLVIAEAALLPEDDLALATALKTPVFGLDDGTLECLARNRENSLYAALQASDAFADIAIRWTDLARRARIDTPFAFFSHLLNAPIPAGDAISGRCAIYARLGTDSGDPLDAFLLEAQGFTGREPGSLLRFVLVQRARESELKRDLEQGVDKVRVMTVHGAKGLEARIVFLADAATKPDRGKEKPAFVLHVPLADKRAVPLLVWSGEKDGETASQRHARAGHRRRTMQEYRRLLYVGMTRAADQLYVSGYSDRARPRNPSAEPAPMEESWHQLVAAGFAEGGARAHMEQDGREIRCFGADPVSVLAGTEEGIPAGKEEPLPDWLFRRLPPSEPVAPPLRPSTGFPLGDARTSPDADEALGRRQRGIFLHRLYELLPGLPAERRETAARLVAVRLVPGVTDHDVAALLRPVLAALKDPATAWIFAEGSRAEVPVAGTVTLPGGGRRAISGRIDRLVVQPNVVDIVDIKTGRERPAVEDGAILRQMALYRALLTGVYPERTIRCHVFWGDMPRTEVLASAALDRVLENIDVKQA